MTRYALKDICTELHSGKGISSSEISDAGKYPVIGGNGVRGYTTKSNFSGECAVIGRQGAACGNVRFFSGDAYMTEHAVIARGNSICDSRYLAYALGQMHLGRLSAQSAQPGLSVKTLGEQVIELPAHEEQEAIVDVLGKLDDKIALNSQINGYLAELQKTIYRQFLNEASGLFHEGTLSELVEVRYGKDHKKLGGGTIPVYGSGGFMRYADSVLYKGEAVLIPRKGTLNNVMYVNEEFWTVDTMFYAVPKAQGAAKYAYQFLRKLDLASMNSGSAVPSMTTKILNALNLPIPSASDLKTLDVKLEPLFETQRMCDRESERLSSLRDALLPKLMSGEIDVSKVGLTQLNSHLSGC